VAEQAEKKQTLGFETEVKQILDLVIHSLYSNKEIFLRELISNASDACDKLRFNALENDKLYGDDSDLGIHVSFDEKARTITVSDNGIGMSQQDMISHLGTIAKSGTKEFFSKLSGDAAKDSNLIGQFGVGFYSAFIVADKVTVDSRRADLPADQGARWESNGTGDYTIESINKPTRGTTITLRLKADESEFLSDWRLRSIITKYSDHISWPIKMDKVVHEEDKTADDKDADNAASTEEKVEEEVVNQATALWARNKSDVSDEQYKEFYKHISHDFSEPLSWVHNHVEGKQHYTSLLYLPTKAPFDMFQQESKHGLKLYVKRVFIMDDAEQFLPRYLRFVKGVIDSSDMPLNVSREILQENKLVESIRKASVKRVLGMLDKMAKNDKDKYAEFWREFGLVLKEGPIEDYSNREDVAKLLRFSSTHDDSGAQSVSLDDYIERMKPEQEQIYFITADTYNTAKNSPHLEIFREKGIEVLLLTDRIDEWLTAHLSEYKEKKLQSITKGKLDLDKLGDKTDEGKEDKDEAKDDDTFASVTKQIQGVLGERVKEVRTTNRLTASPACVVVDENDMGLEMQRILKAAGQDIPESKPIFELNPKHPLLQRLKDETDDARFTELTHILFDQAILAEGGHLDNPGEFVKRLNKMLLELSA
jgi:molecular chaperone HtpG